MSIIDYTKSKLQTDYLFELFGRYYPYIIILVHVLYFSIFIGIMTINSVYIKSLNVFVQLLVCIFLLIRFHPFREHELKKYDSRIIFSCAIFLITNLLFVEGINQYITKYNISNIIK